MLAFIAFTAVYANSVDTVDIIAQRKNNVIFYALQSLNNQYDISKKPDEIRENIKNIIWKFDDPFELARMIVLSYYTSRTGGSEYPRELQAIFIDAYEIYGFERMKLLKSHANFIESMKFIERMIRLDAALSEQFSGIIWDARDIPGIQESFANRLKDYEAAVKRHENIGK